MYVHEYPLIILILWWQRQYICVKQNVIHQFMYGTVCVWCWFESICYHYLSLCLSNINSKSTLLYTLYIFFSQMAPCTSIVPRDKPDTPETSISPSNVKESPVCIYKKGDMSSLLWCLWQMLNVKSIQDAERMAPGEKASGIFPRVASEPHRKGYQNCIRWV